jgi:hypothetical protein
LSGRQPAARGLLRRSDLLLLGCTRRPAARGAGFEIAAKLRLAALQSVCAAGGYFFRGFAFVGDDALIVPWSRLPPDFLIGVGAAVLGRPWFASLPRFAFTWVQPVTCGAGCYICNCVFSLAASRCRAPARRAVTFSASPEKVTKKRRLL